MEVRIWFSLGSLTRKSTYLKRAWTCYVLFSYVYFVTVLLWTWNTHEKRGSILFQCNEEYLEQDSSNLDLCEGWRVFLTSDMRPLSHPRAEGRIKQNKLGMTTPQFLSPLQPSWGQMHIQCSNLHLQHRKMPQNASSTEHSSHKCKPGNWTQLVSFIFHLFA